MGNSLAARNGLGYLIIYASQVFKMDWLILSICLLCIMAMALYAVIGGGGENVPETILKPGTKTDIP